MPPKSMFNKLFNAIFLVSFHNSYKEDSYLLNIVLPYLKPFHHSKFGVPKKTIPLVVLK